MITETAKEASNRFCLFYYYVFFFLYDQLLRVGKFITRNRPRIVSVGSLSGKPAIMKLFYLTL